MDSSEEDRSPSPTILPSAARSVLRTISSIRKNPSLRHGFISGNRGILDGAVGEVRTAFRPKKRGRSKQARVGKSSQELSKKRKTYFKHVIGCLPGPEVTLNPSRQEWDKLYSMGLGKMWRGHSPASIPQTLQEKDLHSLLLSMYPALVSMQYELCKLGGPYNNEVTPLKERDQTITFSPFWTPERLRQVIGNKAQLIIRPLTAISSQVINHRTVS